MVDIAIEKRTKEETPINKARFGHCYACKFCGVDIYPVLGVRNPFYRCYASGKHTNSICMQLDTHARAYDIQQTDADQIFVGLFSPDKEVEPPKGPKGPEGPKEPADPDEGPEEKPEKEPGKTSILPCRTLSQLWKAGIYTLRADTKTGNVVRSDIFLWYKDFERFFKNKTSLGRRILALRPVKPLPNVNAILFVAFSKPFGEEYYEKKYFVLKTNDRKHYNKTCKRLFDLETNGAGADTPRSKYSMVLVAGDWSEIDEKDYANYDVSVHNSCFGAQISLYHAKKQLYPVPKQDIKANT